MRLCTTSGSRLREADERMLIRKDTGRTFGGEPVFETYVRCFMCGKELKVQHKFGVSWMRCFPNHKPLKERYWKE